MRIYKCNLKYFTSNKKLIVGFNFHRNKLSYGITDLYGNKIYCKDIKINHLEINDEIYIKNVQSHKLKIELGK
jgi:hypothetical protein